MCLQTKPSFLVPYLILGVLSIISGSVTIIVFGVYAFLYDLEIGISVVLTGGLTVGKCFQLNSLKYNFDGYANYPVKIKLSPYLIK